VRTGEDYVGAGDHHATISPLSRAKQRQFDATALRACSTLRPSGPPGPALTPLDARRYRRPDDTPPPVAPRVHPRVRPAVGPRLLELARRRQSDGGQRPQRHLRRPRLHRLAGPARSDRRVVHDGVSPGQRALRRGRPHRPRPGRLHGPGPGPAVDEHGERPRHLRGRTPTAPRTPATTPATPAVRTPATTCSSSTATPSATPRTCAAATSSCGYKTPAPPTPPTTSTPGSAAWSPSSTTATP
jgi:hypothetical protein